MNAHRVVSRAIGRACVRAARVFAALAVMLALVPAAANARLVVLAYHDIVDDRATMAQPDAVSVSHLVRQLQWLRESGYIGVRLAEVLQARAGQRTLPAKAVLLTFDDGKRSFLTHALPLLQAYQMPAVVAPVGRWVEQADRGAPEHADKLTSAELREILNSGLVELASHSYDLHREVEFDAYGSTMPAAAARAWREDGADFESAAAFDGRVLQDLQRARQQLKAITGKSPRALVWPYGTRSPRAERLAREAGFEVTFSLEGQWLEKAHVEGRHTIPRKYINNNPGVSTFAWFVEHLPHTPSPRDAMMMRTHPQQSDRALLVQRVDHAIKNLPASSNKTVLLDPISTAECPALVALHPQARAQMMLANWHLLRRARAQVFAVLPSPSCMPMSQWLELAGEIVEFQPLRGAAIRGSSKTQEHRFAMQQLRSRYPELAILSLAEPSSGGLAQAATLLGQVRLESLEDDNERTAELMEPGTLRPAAFELAGSI